VLKAKDETSDLRLDGEEIKLLRVELDGEALGSDGYFLTSEELILKDVPRKETFSLRTEVQIDPQANRQLMGLYRSTDTYCTQCEAEGFRRITFYPDRPDVMSVFTVRIEGSPSSEPVLLGNGNQVDQGTLPEDRHYAVWHDPHPKPAYLFALVAGDLGHIADSFTTASGRAVDLRIYVEHGKEDQALYAMDALKRSMKWDEEKWGREYDLDVFMIVAVSDFNMGAMENKGLNIFNDRLVLASAKTATDGNYNAVEAVIAHEYFHNWTGNRITCRDWFQLCLKEGLTVYRDSEFTADMRSRAVKRIEDVAMLRAAQFPEDGGPLAHPVRPETYREINNFYTATVYEKGAEVVRMLHTLLGDENFKKGADLYFERHDGEATTIEAWLACFEDATGENLDQFALWYSQAGTPTINVEEHFDAGTYTLTVSQSLPETPDGKPKKPMVFPLAFGLLDQTGREIESGLLKLTTESETFRFSCSERPVLSFLREFSAPVKLNFEQSLEDRVHLAAHDTDEFARWQAVQDAAMSALREAALAGGDATKLVGTDAPLSGAIRNILLDDKLDAAFRAFCLRLPDAGTLAQELGQNVDPDQLQSLCEAQSKTLASTLTSELADTYNSIMPTGEFDPGARDANARQLGNACLSMLVGTGDDKWAQHAKTQYEDADNMTNRLAALTALVHYERGDLATNCLRHFEGMYGDQPLVMDLWLGLQARRPGADTLEIVKALTEHPTFSYDVPNRVYSLIRTFAMANITGFNRKDGEGYKFIVDAVLRLNKTNPQVAARVLTAFRSWRMLEPTCAALAKEQLERLVASKNLSTDVSDIAERTLSNG
jgi:aminopeptidase N